MNNNWFSRRGVHTVDGHGKPGKQQHLQGDHSTLEWSPCIYQVASYLCLIGALFLLILLLLIRTTALVARRLNLRHSI